VMVLCPFVKSEFEKSFLKYMVHLLFLINV